MKVVVDGSQRGIVFKNGVYSGFLLPGKHRLNARKFTLERVNISSPFEISGYPTEDFLQDAKLVEELTIKEIPDESLSIHFINGRCKECLTSGRYCFWNAIGEHTFLDVERTVTEVASDFPRYLFDYIPRHLYYKLEVADYQKGLLYFDKKFVRLLDAGVYYFWNNKVDIEVDYVDTRLLQMDITGQEIMTLDKVGLRINFVCQYRITDYIKAITEIDRLEEQLHVLAQLALREYIGRFKLDEILANRERVSEYVATRLKEKEEEYYVTFFNAGVKDFILPGEIREIMNTVLIAEKKAQANVISRREEVASTRSLLNTAKLMEENKTLYRLKELEYLERISENVGELTIRGGESVLEQLSQLVQGKERI